MTQALIRRAELEDLPQLLRIYNHYVRTTHVTFDIDPLELRDRRRWFDDFSEQGPHRLLVVEGDEELFEESEVSRSRRGGVVAYASSRSFRPKAAYRSSVETAVYVDPMLTGKGLGSRVYAALLEALEAEPAVHRAYAGIALPNDDSISLHVGFGFQLVGTLRQVGHKFGRYWDLSWYERSLEPDDLK